MVGLSTFVFCSSGITIFHCLMPSIPYMSFIIVSGKRVNLVHCMEMEVDLILFWKEKNKIIFSENSISQHLCTTCTTLGCGMEMLQLLTMFILSNEVREEFNTYWHLICNSTAQSLGTYVWLPCFTSFVKD